MSLSCHKVFCILSPFSTYIIRHYLLYCKIYFIFFLTCFMARLYDLPQTLVLCGSTGFLTFPAVSDTLAGLCHLGTGAIFSCRFGRDAPHPNSNQMPAVAACRHIAGYLFAPGFASSPFSTNSHETPLEFVENFLKTGSLSGGAFCSAKSMTEPLGSGVVSVSCPATDVPTVWRAFCPHLHSVR